MVVVANLKPATLRGVESQGMILAAGFLSIFAKDVTNAGSRISLPVLTLLRMAWVAFAATLSAIILWNARGEAVHAGEQITIRTRVLGGGGKKMHLWHEMFSGHRLLPTAEHFLLHVSLETRKPTDAGASVDAALRRFVEAQSGLPRPEGAGRWVGAPR